MRCYDKDSIFGNGLIIDYQLNEGAGVYVYDLSQNKITGTGVSLAAGNWVTVVNGVVPLMTLDLDGGADYVNLGTSTIFDSIATTNAITIEAVILCDSALLTHMVFGGWVTGTGGDGGYPQLMVDVGKLEWRPTQDTGETSIVESVTSINGALYHVVATYAESDKVARILINGGETEDKSVTLVCTNDTLRTLGAESAYIGTRYNQLTVGVENYFDGHIVFLRVWSRRLSDFEQKFLFKNARGVLGL